MMGKAPSFYKNRVFCQTLIKDPSQVYREPSNGKDIKSLALIVDFDNSVRQLMTGTF